MQHIFWAMEIIPFFFPRIWDLLELTVLIYTVHYHHHSTKQMPSLIYFLSMIKCPGDWNLTAEGTVWQSTATCPINQVLEGQERPRPSCPPARLPTVVGRSTGRFANICCLPPTGTLPRLRRAISSSSTQEESNVPRENVGYKWQSGSNGEHNLTLIGMMQGGFTPLIIFGLDLI